MFNMSQHKYDFDEISLTKNFLTWFIFISFSVISIPFIYRNNIKMYLREWTSPHVSQHNYNLGAEHCRQTFRQDVVCIFVHEKLKFSNVNLNEFCKDDDLEACAVKLPFASGNICTLAIYRTPSGNFLHFLNGLDAILKSLYNTHSFIHSFYCSSSNPNR
jgi:hypothetical protein